MQVEYVRIPSPARRSILERAGAGLGQQYSSRFSAPPSSPFPSVDDKLLHPLERVHRADVVVRLAGVVAAAAGGLVDGRAEAYRWRRRPWRAPVVSARRCRQRRSSGWSDGDRRQEVTWRPKGKGEGVSV